MTERKPKRNRRLLLKTADRIERIPESYDQGVFACESETAPCGTIACLAGEIIICSERNDENGIKKLFDLNAKWQVSTVAAELAGLTEDELSNVFYGVSSWPRGFRDRWTRSKTKRGEANAAAALLRYLADGGEV